jgi:hypothetical protein
MLNCDNFINVNNYFLPEKDWKMTSVFKKRLKKAQKF